jgi:hypothetical protein
MRPLVRLAAALLLGAFISFGTTCGELGLGGPYHPLPTDARPAVPEALYPAASATPVFGQCPASEARLGPERRRSVEPCP